MNLEILRRTAAEIAAAAVYELYPDVVLLGGKSTAVGFSYDFIFPHPIHIHIIEEKIREIVREKRPVRTLEMVPFSASELLKANGHHVRAGELDERGLVEVIQMGSFHDLSPGPHLKNTAELAAFKIEAKALGEKRMQITGWCHRSKEELKQFLKQLERYVEPQLIGEKMGLWKGAIWLPLGLKMREQLIQLLKKEWFDFEVSVPMGSDRYKEHREMGRKVVGEVWTKGHRETYIQVSFFEELNSCLHLIGKTLTILGFNHSLSSEGFVVEDGIGRSQVLARVEKRENGCKVIAYVECILDQMIERNLWVKLEN